MDQFSRSAAPIGQLAWATLALSLWASPVAAEVAVTGSGFLGADEWGFWHEQYGLDLAHSSETSGQQLALRAHRYALRDELEGVLAFSGHEPAARLSAHALFDDVLWLGASAGFQGTLDVDGTTGELIAAYAIALGERDTLTPRIELAREPLALSPLPLSLGLHSHRAQSALAWKRPGLSAEGGARIDHWEGDTVYGRARNSARDRIEPNRVVTGYAYAMTDGSWLDAGLAAKVSVAEQNTLLPTQLTPERRYTWYPAAAPPLLWETSAIVRLQSEPGETFEVKLQLGLPLVSREVREWEGVRVASWGSAPYEAALDVGVQALEDTRLELQARLFIKPWEGWDALSDGAYRHASVRVALEQRI